VGPDLDMAIEAEAQDCIRSASKGPAMEIGWRGPGRESGLRTRLLPSGFAA
jgi:hypothetical protein